MTATALQEREFFATYNFGVFKVNEDGVSATIFVPQTHMVGFLDVTVINDDGDGNVVDTPTLDVVIDAVAPDGQTYELDAFTQATGVTSQRLVADLDPILDHDIRVRWALGRATTRGRPEWVFQVRLQAKASQ